VKRITLATVTLLALGLAGCAPKPVPPPRVSVPVVDHGTEPPLHVTDRAKPMPPEAEEPIVPPPPFPDAPLVSQRIPEQSAFIDAYNRVGRPRICVVVNRSPDADAMQTALADWLACNGQVTMVSSNTSEKLYDVADVLVQVHANTTREYRDGPRVRIVAEARNTKGGVSIGRALVDVPQPLEKTQINYYTRWVARKLMTDMTDSWLQPAPEAMHESAPPAPSSTTAPQ